jgi:hypothetical protein
MLVAALAIAPFAAAGQAQAAVRPMTSGCGSALTTEYVYFPDISATTPVASLKLMSGGCAYLWMWSWFTASHSGWDVGLTTCPIRDQGLDVYPVTNASGATSYGCAKPYVWTNTSQVEFYGPAANYGCDYAAVQLIYNRDNILSATDSYCTT